MLIGPGRLWKLSLKCIPQHQLPETKIAQAESDSFSFLLLPKESVSDPFFQREVILDPCCDDFAYRSSWLNCFDLCVVAIEHDDRLSASRVERIFELAIGVGRIDRARDCSGLPRTNLSDDELRAV